MYITERHPLYQIYILYLHVPSKLEYIMCSMHVHQRGFPTKETYYIKEEKNQKQDEQVKVWKLTKEEEGHLSVPTFPS